MSSDKRKKGCPNEMCENHLKKKLIKAGEDYCPKCGTKLIFVCPKCFRQIEDIDPKHKICRYCKQQGKDNRDKVVDGTKKVGKIVAAAAGTALFANNMIKEGKADVIKDGAKVICELPR